MPWVHEESRQSPSRPGDWGRGWYLYQRNVGASSLMAAALGQRGKGGVCGLGTRLVRGLSKNYSSFIVILEYVAQHKGERTTPWFLLLHFLGDIIATSKITECKAGNTLLFEQLLQVPSCFPIHPKPPKTMLLKLNFSAMEVGV